MDSSQRSHNKYLTPTRSKSENKDEGHHSDSNYGSEESLNGDNSIMDNTAVTLAEVRRVFNLPSPDDDGLQDLDNDQFLN